MNIKKFFGFFRSAFIVLIFISNPGEIMELKAQINQYYFSNVDSTEEYTSTGFCKTLNYYWDQGLIDAEGNIYFIFVDNYKLYYFVSSDLGETWTRHHVETEWDGYVYNAMAGLAQDGRLVIPFSVNLGFNSGSVPYGSEFKYSLKAAVQNGDGWNISTLKDATANSGLLPYGIITTKSGLVHVILYKYGWWNYGGELYEAMFNPSENTWSAVETIKIFNDRPVDHSTFHVCKLAEGENDSIICVYQRHRNDTKYNNLEVIKKGAGGWTEEEIILDNSNYSTYNRFDMDYDRHGHMYLVYFIPYGPEGPEVFVAHNSVREYEKFTPFDQADTLRKISVHPYPDGVAYLYLNFKDSLPEIWKISESGMEATGWLPEFAQEDSADVVRFHYQIPLKNNFSVIPGAEESDTGPGLYAFTNRYQGKEGNTVLKYPIVFVKANLEFEETEITFRNSEYFQQSFRVYPNPGNGRIRILRAGGDGDEIYSVYTIQGTKIAELNIVDNEAADLGEIPGGIYLIRDSSGNTVKYLKH